MPVVALSIIGLSVVPESRDSRRRPLDLPGAALVTSGSLAVVYGIIQGGESGWTSNEIVGSLVGGALLLTGFAVVELSSASPMLPLQYFKRMDFTSSFLVLMLLFFGMVGVFFFLTQFLQLVQDRSALVAGLAITPVAAAMMVGALISTKAVPRFGPKATIVVSMLIVMAGMGVFSQIEVSTPYYLSVLGIMLFGLGAGIAMPTVTDTIMASVPVDDAGIGSAMNDLSRELGITLGVAVLGSLVANLYRTNVREALEGTAPAATIDQVGESIGAVTGSQPSCRPPWRHWSPAPRINRSSTPSASATSRRPASSPSPSASPPPSSRRPRARLRQASLMRRRRCWRSRPCTRRATAPPCRPRPA